MSVRLTVVEIGRNRAALGLATASPAGVQIARVPAPASTGTGVAAQQEICC